MAGSVGETLSAYVSIRTTAGVTPSIMNRITAAPPRIEKIGAPSAPARITIASQGQAGCPSSTAGERMIASAARRPSEARRRPAHVALACPTSRSATSTKPTGSTSWVVHTGMLCADGRPRFALGEHELHGAPGEQAGDARGDGAGNDRRGASTATLRDERAGGEREQLVVARGNRRAKKRDPEDEMLNDGTGGGNADTEHAPRRNFQQGQHNHPRERSRGNQIFDEAERAAHRAAPAALRCLNASRSFSARSKMSAGTMSPRIALARAFASVFHSGPSAFVTVSPCLLINATANLS